MFLFVFFISYASWAQEDAWVYFNTKINEQSYLDSPKTMLSQRALDRRKNQNIGLDFKDIPINNSFVNQLKKLPDLLVLAQSKWLNAVHVRGSITAIKALKSLAFVDNIDFANKALNENHTKRKKNKNKGETVITAGSVGFTYGTSDNQITMLNGSALHQKNYTGLGKVIAVLDGGFPGVNTIQTFKRLRDNNKILGGYDFVNRSDDFYSGGTHGTYVLSSMGGYKENALVGTAPDASYYLFITEDNSYENPVEESFWVEAAEKADSLGVDIITTSLGYFGDHTNPAYNHTYDEMTGDATFISKGANIAFSRGMIVVASAGNEGETAEPHIGSPADAFSVIAVGAVTAKKLRAAFSSIGPSYDGRIKPDVMAQGQSTVLSDEDGNVVTSNGTSFSGPIIAGMTACLWQAFPNKTNQQIKEMILASSDRYKAPTNQYGYGIPDFNAALINGLKINKIDNQASNNYFYISPNPTSNSVTVSFPETYNKGKVTFFSVYGQKVLENNSIIPSETISLKTLATGSYFYKFEVDTYTKTGKIIKN